MTSQERKPLILADDPTTGISGQPVVQRLRNNDLNIPLQWRFDTLQVVFISLVGDLINEGFNLSEDVLTYYEELKGK